jgi:hypothetical protein
VITIDVRRDDGEVTRLHGVAGMAVMLPEVDLPEGALDADALMRLVGDGMPVVSLRADNAAQLAVMLGVLMATIRDHCPEALVAAGEVARYAQAARPQWRRKLP